MSVLDTNFDSPREMPSRAAWLDNASAQLLNDNSYFNAAPNSSEPAWLGKVDLFDSAREPAAIEDVPTGDPVPVPEEPAPEEPPHTPEEKPGVPIVLLPAGETPPDGPRLADQVPEGHTSIDDYIKDLEQKLANQVAPEQETAQEPTPEPAPEPAWEPGSRPPSKNPEGDTSTEPSAPASGPVGPRAVGPGLGTPGTPYVGESLPGNGPPEHTGPSLPYTSRAEKREWEAKQRAEMIAQQQAAAAAAAANDPGPGPDGRNADGTYGAGHHQYTPPSYYPDNTGTGMTEQNRPAMLPEEIPAPVYTPRVQNQAAIQALVEAMKRYRESGQSTGQTGPEGGGPLVAHADPNYQPGPPGSFGGLRGGRVG